MTNGQSRCENLTASMGKLVSSHPGKIVLLFLLITLLMLIPLRRIDTSTKMSDYLPACEYLDADAVLRNEFEAPFSVVSILQADDGNVLDKQGLDLLTEIEQAIWASDQITPFLIDYDDAVVSIADAVEAVVFSLSSGLYGLDDAPEDVLEEAIDEILADENTSILVSIGNGPERKYAALLVRFNHNMIDRDDETTELALMETMNKHVPDGYKLTYVAARSYHMRKDAKEGLQSLLPISLVLVCVILIVALRSLADFLISIIGLASVMIISFGAFSLLNLQFSQITFFAPIVIMILAIDYAIHLILRYKEYQRGGLQASEAMSKGIRFTGLSVLFSALTTVFAFGSNGLSNIPAVASFGLFLAMGISISFVVMMLFVPALKLSCVRLLQIVSKKQQAVSGQIDLHPSADLAGQNCNTNSDRPISAVESFLLNSLSLGLVAIAVGLCVAGLSFGRNIKRDMTSEDIYAADSPVAMNQQILNDKFPSLGRDRAYIIIEADICAPQVLRAVEESIDNLADDEHVAKLEGKAKLTSIIHYVQEAARLQTNALMVSDTDGDGLPDTREGMNKVLTRLYDKGENNIASTGFVKSLLSKGPPERPFDMILLIVETHNTQGTNVGKLLAELDDDFGPLRDVVGTRIRYAGFLFERYKIITEMTRGMTKSTFVSILLCTAIAILLFRSFKFGLITALPIIFITGWILGIMLLFDFTLNMVTATITAMSIGIGIDYSIHLVERYRHEKRAGASITESMAKSLATTGPSLFAAAGTTIGGFLVLAFGKIGMIKSFGVLASLAIIFALASSVMVLPAMLVASEKFTLWLSRKRGS